MIVGVFIGLLSRVIKPGTGSMGWIWTIILGIAGTFIGSYISTFFVSMPHKSLVIGVLCGWRNDYSFSVYELLFGKKIAVDTYKIKY